VKLNFNSELIGDWLMYLGCIIVICASLCLIGAGFSLIAGAVSP
jgi:hypothetical protein